MKIRAESVISQRLRGAVSEVLLEEIEKETPSVDCIHKYLVKDLSLKGLKVRSESVRLIGDVFSVSLNEQVNFDIDSLYEVLDTYSRIYPEFEFVIGKNPYKPEINKN